MTKAKYIGSTQSMDRNYLDMHFEYRGKAYIVTRALNWMSCSSDYTSRNGSKAEWRQHKEAQEAIDSEIEAEKNPQPIPKGTWTKEYEDMIYKMISGEWEE